MVVVPKCQKGNKYNTLIVDSTNDDCGVPSADPHAFVYPVSKSVRGCACFCAMPWLHLLQRRPHLSIALSAPVAAKHESGFDDVVQKASATAFVSPFKQRVEDFYPGVGLGGVFGTGTGAGGRPHSAGCRENA